MAYLFANRLAFGNYAAPRHAPRIRRGVRFAGRYGLGFLGDADWSGFITTLQHAFVPTFPPIPIGLIVLKQVLGTTTPSSSQINPGVANQLILALGNFKLSGAAGAARDALWRQLAAIVANPPQMPAPPAPVATPIVTPTLPPTVATPTPGATGTYSGTPVPLGFPTNETFVDSSGNQWQYNSTNGTWQNATLLAQQAAIASEQAQAAQIAAATATTPQGAPQPVLVTSPTVSPTLSPVPGGSPVSVTVSSPTSSTYSDVLNWLSESTLISPVPNWVIAGAAVFAAIKLSGKGHLL